MYTRLKFQTTGAIEHDAIEHDATEQAATEQPRHGSDGRHNNMPPGQQLPYLNGFIERNE